MKAVDTRGFVEGIAQYIQKEGRQSLIPKMTEVFGKLSSASEKESKARVITSVALSPEESKDLERFLFRLVDHPVTIQNTVDKNLIGGMKVELGDWTIDTSVNGQIDRMAKDILE